MLSTYKLLVLGIAGVGKSTLTVQYIRNEFVESYNPTVEESYVKNVVVDGREIILDILDIAGVDDFSAVRQLSMKSGHAFMIVYSVIDRQSFLAVPEFRDDILNAKNVEEAAIIIVGNKSDMPGRDITLEEGQALAAKFEVPFLEASAKQRINVEESFMLLAKQITKFNPLEHTGSKNFKRNTWRKNRNSKCIVL
eukprot:TRINITY_DN4552_c1_g1_i2.p1 TRINITY_DN4552_c1_g1~~TRINITY_DN4552_c1_g1_i2.p1  ORF type:complete len:195 (-),score=31.67 TRINITY_DN4552_c1_g1_i2:56-640(-)